VTTQEWHEADQDDADRVRAWPAQDAQEPSDDRYYVSLLIEKDQEIAELKSLLADSEQRCADIHARLRRSASDLREDDKILVERDAEIARLRAGVARMVGVKP